MSLRCAPVALFATLAGAAVAQHADQAALCRAFDDASLALASASPDGRQAAAIRASALFLQIPLGAARNGRLATGAEATLTAGRKQLALKLAAAEGLGSRPPKLVTVELRALAQLGRFGVFVRALQRADEAHPAAVRVALAAEESRLLPLAAEALRGGGSRAGGRHVFARLAALRPFRSYRLANLALCLRQVGAIDEAFRAYGRGRELAPADLELWNDYGLLLRATGRRAEAVAAFRRSVALDLARPVPLRARGPAITNLLHMEALSPGEVGDDPVPIANSALTQRPQATMLRRLMIDVQLDRLTRQ